MRSGKPQHHGTVQLILRNHHFQFVVSSLPIIFLLVALLLSVLAFASLAGLPKREWTCAGRFEILFVLRVKQEGGRIIINEPIVLTTTPPRWFTGEEGDFGAARAIPASGVEGMVGLLVALADPERTARNRP
jgi:uncharacterized membrane protein YtjA (UPF0391 family)